MRNARRRPGRTSGPGDVKRPQARRRTAIKRADSLSLSAVFRFKGEQIRSGSSAGGGFFFLQGHKAETNQCVDGLCTITVRFVKR